MGQHLPGNRNNFEWINREEEEKQHHEWKNYWTIVSEAKGRQTHTHTKKAKTKTGDTAYLLICASLFMYVMCLVNVHFCISGLAVNTSLFLNWIETNEKTSVMSKGNEKWCIWKTASPENALKWIHFNHQEMYLIDCDDDDGDGPMAELFC